MPNDFSCWYAEGRFRAGTQKHEIEAMREVKTRESNRLKYRSGSGSRNLIFNGSVPVQVQNFSKIWVQVQSQNLKVRVRFRFTDLKY